MFIQKIFTLGSLFDGIGGWPLAAVRAGICPVWASEIDDFPIGVTKIRFPAMRHLGDIQKINGADIPPVDIICAGSPCQDLSIAGNRDGLKGKRSGLFVRAMDIVKQMRNATNGKYPRYFVWENVPGAFSSNKRHDFQAVLEEITEGAIPMPKSGRWANAGMVRSANGQTAWRVLDAQFWGVPQHRERVFIIHDYGGTSAGQILFECEGLRGNIEPRRTETKSITKDVKKGVDPTIFKERAGKPGGGKEILINNSGKAFTLSTSCDMTLCKCGGYSNYYPAGIASTQRRCTNDTDLVLYDMHHPSDVIRQHKGICPSLMARMGTGGNNVPLTYAIGNGQADNTGLKNIAGALNCMHDQQAIIQESYCIAGNTIDRKLQNGGNGKGVNTISYTLNTIDRHAIYACRTIRRLTPLECERLQGLPDNWTLIESKKCSDSARYKAIGNGMAQPCADFIIQGIYNILSQEGTKMTELEIERCIAATSELRGILERAPKSPERERAIEKCTNDISAFSLAVKVLQEDKKPKKEKSVEELPEVKQTKRPDPPAKAKISELDDDDLI